MRLLQHAYLQWCLRFIALNLTRHNMHAFVISF
jgi:hypothetical protein